MKNIKTGVDKLVELISEKKRIELDDAAKRLGVGRPVVQEWAEFLEQEGLISIDYTLSRVWLSAKKITKDDVINNAKEVSSEKDALLRKIDVALKSLDSETLGFEEVKRHFLEIQSHIKTEIDTVKTELDELQRYESLRQNLDKDILSQKKDYDALINKYISDMKLQEGKYSDLILDIDKEKKNLESFKSRMDDLKRLKEESVNVIESSKEALKNIEKALFDGTSRIAEVEKRLLGLKANADKISAETTTLKSKDMADALKIVQTKSNKTLAQLDELYKKAEERTSKMVSYSDTSKKIYASFRGFFIKNIETEKLLNDISEEKLGLSKDLQMLKNKALAFSLMTKDVDIKTQMKDIEAAMKNIDQRRTGLKSKIERLMDIIKVGQ